MSVFFPSYRASSIYDINAKTNFDSRLQKFLNTETYNKTQEEFTEIRNFLTYQSNDFLEENFLSTCSKIIQSLNANRFIREENYLITLFVNMVKEDKFKDMLPKLQNYDTADSLKLISFLLVDNNLKLAEDLTNIFINPEQRTLKSLDSNNLNIVEWCLKNREISVLKFLTEKYEGFNSAIIQKFILDYKELGEDIVNKAFPDNIYPNSLSHSIESLFNNDSIVLSKKLELISYFSKKTAFIPKELVSFIKEGLTSNFISTEVLKKCDFYDKLICKETLSNFLPYSSPNYIFNLKKYLSLFEQEDKVSQISLELVLNNTKKVDFKSIIIDFIKEYPDFAKEKSLEIKKYIIDNNCNVDLNLFYTLNSSLVIDEELKKYLVNQNQDLYFNLKNHENDPEYINKSVQFIIENGIFPDFNSPTSIQPVVNKIFQNLNNEQLVNLFLLQNNLFHNLKTLKKTNTTIVVDLITLEEKDREKLLKNLALVIDPELLVELQPKKWYQLNSDKPLQLILKNGVFSIITKVEDKISIVNIESEDNLPSISPILSQAKKDLAKFNKIISEEVDFNLEFKIRSESIFMQQMAFLNQIQKIETDLKFEDLYFLKNNLGKYLIQCTETYSRSLKRHQTLLENPTLLKKTDNSLEYQKEKIDLEALKQVNLLEKELNFVKDNVINTVNSENFSAMKINTRFLQSRSEHTETTSVVKLVSNKLK